MKRTLLIAAATTCALIFLAIRCLRVESTIDSTWYHVRARLILKSGWQIPMNGPDQYFLEADGFGRALVCFRPDHLVSDPDGRRLAFSCGEGGACIAYLNGGALFVDCSQNQEPLDWKTIKPFRDVVGTLRANHDFAALSHAIKADLSSGDFEAFMLSHFGSKFPTGHQEWNRVLASASPESRDHILTALAQRVSQFTPDQTVAYVTVVPEGAVTAEQFAEAVRAGPPEREVSNAIISLVNTHNANRAQLFACEAFKAGARSDSLFAVISEMTAPCGDFDALTVSKLDSFRDLACNTHFRCTGATCTIQSNYNAHVSHLLDEQEIFVNAASHRNLLSDALLRKLKGPCEVR